MTKIETLILFMLLGFAAGAVISLLIIGMVAENSNRACESVGGFAWKGLCLDPSVVI